MPLFRFHLRTPRGLEYDAQGLDLPDLDAAYLDACAAVPALAAEFLKAGRDPLVCTFLIADAEDRPLLEVPFRERLREPPARPARNRTRPPNGSLERARELVGALRHEHARLQDNLSRLRALVTEPLSTGDAPVRADAAQGLEFRDSGRKR